LPLIVLVWVVRRSFQIILAEASVGGGFFQRPANGKPLLLVGNEVSGSTTIFQLNLAY
jgi:hypothetical protein